MFEVNVYTGCVCSGNPGLGAYGALVVCGKNELKLSGHSEGNTTNHRMELTAAVEAVEKLKKPCNITVHTNNNFVCHGIAELDNLPALEWKTKTGATWKHSDLLKRLYNAKHDVGHAIRFKYEPETDPECKKMASAAMEVQ